MEQEEKHHDHLPKENSDALRKERAEDQPPGQHEQLAQKRLRWRVSSINTGRRWMQLAYTHALEGILLVLSLMAFGILAATVAGRITFPYCLEWMEGGMVDHVARVLEGKHLYVPPSASFVPFIYSPMFYWVSAAVALVVGLGYLPLRIVSVLALLGAMACIVLFVRKEGGRWVPAIASAALFAGTFQLSGRYFDVGRTDSLSVCLLMWTTFFVRFGKGARAAAGAALLLALSYLTKQYSVAIAAPMAVYLLWANRKRAYWFLGIAVCLVVGTDLIMNAVTDGWYWYYTHRVPSGHALLWNTMVPKVRFEVVAPFALAYAVVVWLFASRTPLGTPCGRLFYAMQFSGFLAMALMSRIHFGSAPNVLMPLHAGIAVAFGVGLHAARAHAQEMSNQIHRSFTIVAILQLALLLQDSEAYMPTPDDRAEGDAWVERVKAIPGPVWVGYRGHMGSLACKGRHATMMAMLDVIKSEADYKDAKALLRKDVDQILEKQHFDLVIMDNFDFWFLPTLQKYYERDGVKWFSKRDAMMPRAGAKIRPEHGYRPRRAPKQPNQPLR